MQQQLAHQQLNNNIANNLTKSEQILQDMHCIMRQKYALVQTLHTHYTITLTATTKSSGHCER